MGMAAIYIVCFIQLWPCSVAGGEAFLDTGNRQPHSWSGVIVFRCVEAEDPRAPNNAKNPAADQHQLIRKRKPPEENVPAHPRHC